MSTGSSISSEKITSWFRNTNASSRRCSRFSSELVSRLSTQSTRLPCSSRYSHRCEPRNPAPPVTTAVGIRLIVPTSQAGSPWFSRALRSPYARGPGGDRDPSSAVLVRLPQLHDLVLGLVQVLDSEAGVHREQALAEIVDRRRHREVRVAQAGQNLSRQSPERD